jgi:AraC family transcriptional regulator
MSQRITNANTIRAIDYILLNLENELTVENIASHCNSSKYHFSRIFKEQVGESVYAFVKRLRVERSASRIGLERDLSITAIGMDYGYSSSNFSSVFSKHLSLSPAQFRQLKLENRYDLTSPFDDSKMIYHSYEYYDERVTINQLDDVRIVYNRYIGSYRDLRILCLQFLEETPTYTRPYLVASRYHITTLISRIWTGVCLICA